MPEEYSLKTLPKPVDNRIRILELPAYKTAVIRFSGFNTDKNIKTHEKTLTEWLETNDIKSVGKSTYAFYNPPWTPPFMKRNEIMIRIPK